ncbi:hypothetical protein HF086_018252 [Spodoptera exigua]|uniref:LIM zinc-binding domain-containing protein n=1 Tax=Spodoptera exigua TaxID=7107 RepID=A0A922S8D8_SPOEX|nr:hypothetical protein HF086_018252 [Spodoptera exigua]
MLKERESSEDSPAAPDECAGCGGRIQDRYYLLAVDRQWHGTCLRCCECRLPLDTELTCFSRDGNIYCKEDYYRCQDLHSEGDSPSQYYNGGPSQKGRPRKRKIPQGSPDDMQVQTMRMASTALDNKILHNIILTIAGSSCEGLLTKHVNVF